MPCARKAELRPRAEANTINTGRNSQPAQQYTSGRLATTGALSTSHSHTPIDLVNWVDMDKDRVRNVRSSSRTSEKMVWGGFIHHHHFVFGWRLLFSLPYCLKSASGDDLTTFLILFNDTEKQ
jgi:hypothetical protein